MDISQTMPGWQDLESVLVTGARGMLGTELVAALRRSRWRQKHRHDPVHPCDIDEMDITNPGVIEKYLSTRQPQLVINCAADTDVDGCESNPARAYAINAEGPMHLARVCRRHGCKLVHISTDFVFDGKGRWPYRPTDETGPLSVYGKSKLAGEQAVQKELDEYLIVRTAWLFGKAGRNFVSTIRQLAQEKNQIEVIKDQVGSPTYAVDLAAAIINLVNVAAEGIYHFANTGRCSWYEFACEIVRCCGFRTKVTPVTSAKLKRPAPRPAWSVLDTGKYQKATGCPVRPWQDALAEYLGEI